MGRMPNVTGVKPASGGFIGSEFVGGSLGGFGSQGRWLPVLLRGPPAEAFLELPEGTLCSTQLRVAGIETKTWEKDLKLLSTNHSTSKTLDPRKYLMAKGKTWRKQFLKASWPRLTISTSPKHHPCIPKRIMRAFFWKFCKLQTASSIHRRTWHQGIITHSIKSIKTPSKRHPKETSSRSMITVPHQSSIQHTRQRIHGLGIYLPTWMVNFYGILLLVNVGKDNQSHGSYRIVKSCIWS